MPASRRPRLVLASSALLVAAGAAAGQSPTSAEAAPPPQPATEPEPAAPASAITPAQRPIVYSLSVRGEIGLSADLSDSPGEVSVSRAGATLGAAVPIGERAQLSLGFDYELSSYDFDNATGLIAGTGSPFEDVQRYSVSARYAHQLSRQWSLVGGGSVGISGEEGAKTSDSIVGAGYIGGRYALSESVQTGFGLVFATQLEDDALFLPLLMLDWQINEQWRLSNEGRLGLTLSYAPVESWSFGLGAEYQNRDFRLDRDGPVPGGVGRETRIPLTLSASYTPTRHLSIEAGIGVGVYREFEILDSGGRELADFDADASPFLRLQVSYRF